MPSVAGAFPSVSALWIVSVGLGALAALTKDSATAVVNKLQTRTQQKKSSRCGRGTRNDQLYVTILGCLHVAPIIYSTGKVKEG